MNFLYKRKIFGFECDIYGHLNNANYFHIFEEARAEFLEQTDYSIARLKELNISIFVRSMKIDFIKSVPLGAKINVSCKIKSLNKLKSTWVQTIINEKNEICTTLEIDAVFVKNNKPFRLPSEILEHYKKYQ